MQRYGNDNFVLVLIFSRNSLKSIRMSYITQKFICVDNKKNRTYKSHLIIEVQLVLTDGKQRRHANSLSMIVAADDVSFTSPVGEFISLLLLPYIMASLSGDVKIW